MADVKFNKTKTESEALSASVSNPNTIYFTSDTHNIVLGGHIMGDTSALANRVLALEQKNTSISVTCSAVNSSIKHYTGSSISMQLTGTVKMNGALPPPDAVISWTVSNGSFHVEGNTNSISATDTASSAGTFTYTINVTVTYLGKAYTTSTSVKFYIVKPSYVGFSTASTASSGMQSDFSTSSGAVWDTNITKNFTLTHSEKEYLWILSPYSVSSVKMVSNGFTTNISVQLVSTISGIKYYKSTTLLSASSNVTYKINQ